MNGSPTLILKQVEFISFTFHGLSLGIVQVFEKDRFAMPAAEIMDVIDLIFATLSGWARSASPIGFVLVPASKIYQL